MQIIEQFNKAKDNHGLISDRVPGRSTGNGLMYTAEWAWQLNQEFLSGHITQDDFEKERESILKAYSRCEISDGHYARLPDLGFGHNAPDDYFGVGLTSHLLDPEMAVRVLKAARENAWMLNERQPGVWRWKSWLGRMPQLVAHLQFAAGEMPNIYRQVLWGVSLVLTSFKPYKKQDSHSKAWMMVQVAQGRSRYLDLVCAWYMSRFKRAYPTRFQPTGEQYAEGLGALRNSYGWPRNHPTVNLIRGW